MWFQTLPCATSSAAFSRKGNVHRETELLSTEPFLQTLFHPKHSVPTDSFSLVWRTCRLRDYAEWLCLTNTLDVSVLGQQISHAGCKIEASGTEICEQVLGIKTRTSTASLDCFLSLHQPSTSKNKVYHRSIHYLSSSYIGNSSSIQHEAHCHLRCNPAFGSGFCESCRAG